LFRPLDQLDVIAGRVRAQASKGAGLFCIWFSTQSDCYRYADWR